MMCPRRVFTQENDVDYLVENLYYWKTFHRGLKVVRQILPEYPSEGSFNLYEDIMRASIKECHSTPSTFLTTEVLNSSLPKEWGLDLVYFSSRVIQESFLQRPVQEYLAILEYKKLFGSSKIINTSFIKIQKEKEEDNYNIFCNELQPTKWFETWDIYQIEVDQLLLDGKILLPPSDLYEVLDIPVLLNLVLDSLAKEGPYYENLDKI